MSNKKKETQLLNEEDNLSRKKLFKTLSSAEKSRRRSTMSALTTNRTTNINPLFSFEPDVAILKFNEKSSFSDGSIELNKNKKSADEKVKSKKKLSKSLILKKRLNSDKDEKIGLNRKNKNESHSDLLLTSKLDKTKKKRLQKELDKLEKQKSKQENQTLQTLDRILKVGMESALLPSPSMKLITSPPTRPPVLKT